MSELSAERLRSLLTYEPHTGLFRIACYRGVRRRAGDVAGAPNSAGYICVKVDGRKYQAHRLAWLYVHGVWPMGVIDHINGMRTDNRIANLREATRQQNKHNSDVGANSKSGVRGVFWNAKRRKWQARVCLPNGKRQHLGYFYELEDATAAVTAAYQDIHGEFARGATHANH